MAERRWTAHTAAEFDETLMREKISDLLIPRLPIGLWTTTLLGLPIVSRVFLSIRAVADFLVLFSIPIPNS